MSTAFIAPEPPAKTYRLYLPGYTKVMLPAMFGLFTLFGIAMVAGVFPGDHGQARTIGLVWLFVVGIFWYRMLTIPHRIDVLADGRAIFVSLAKRVELSPLAIMSIKPQGNRFGMYYLLSALFGLGSLSGDHTDRHDDQRQRGQTYRDGRGHAWMAATESLSSCAPQANSQPEPPMAQAPKPIGVMNRSEFPSRFVFMVSPSLSLTNVPFEGVAGRQRSFSPSN